MIALVGYTNAGKSTLLNSLTEAGVVAEDKLFATLDPTTRRVSLPSTKQVCTPSWLQPVDPSLLLCWTQLCSCLKVLSVSHMRHGLKHTKCSDVCLVKIYIL